MKNKLITTLLSLPLISCGGSSSDSANTASVNFGLSDAPVEALSSVVVTIDTMTLTSAAGETLVIEEFANPSEPSSPLSAVQINLLDYQGSDYLSIVEGFDLPVGEYESLNLSIADDDIADTYAEESDGAIKPLKIPSDTLRLGGFTVGATNEQTFVIEFDLRKSMTYNPGPDRYILKPRGVRINEVSQSASVEGQIDLAYFNGLPPCSDKVNPNEGHVIYLYEGHDLRADLLVDEYDPDVNSSNTTESIAPYSSVSVDEMGRFELAFLDPGNYTLVYSCDAADDDPDTVDNLTIPSPAGTLVEITLEGGESTSVELPVVAP
jgi:hypothetical protein